MGAARRHRQAVEADVVVACCEMRLQYGHSVLYGGWVGGTSHSACRRQLRAASRRLWGEVLSLRLARISPGTGGPAGRARRSEEEMW